MMISSVALLVIIASTMVSANEWFTLNGHSFHHKCIFNAEGATVEHLPNGGGANLRYTDGRIVHVPTCAHLRRNPDDVKFQLNWRAMAVQETIMTFDLINANWTVPSAPSQSDDKLLLSYWVGLENVNQPITTFLGPAVHWGTVVTNDGSKIGGQYWTIVAWDADVDSGQLFHGTPRTNITAGSAIRSYVTVNGDTCHARAIIVATGVNSNIISWSSFGDVQDSIARIGVSADGVDDISCNRLPASGFIGYKDIRLTGAQDQPITPAFDAQYPSPICNHQVIPKDDTIAITWNTK